MTTNYIGKAHEVGPLEKKKLGTVSGQGEKVYFAYFVTKTEDKEEK